MNDPNKNLNIFTFTFNITTDKNKTINTQKFINILIIAGLLILSILLNNKYLLIIAVNTINNIT